MKGRKEYVNRQDRQLKKYAWFPIKINGGVVWLEYYIQFQEYNYYKMKFINTVRECINEEKK